MTELQHTPGPWILLPHDDDGSISIVAGNLGGLVGAAHCWPTEIITQGSGRVDANAHLIAAAPDLLAALKDAADEVEDLRKYANNHGGMIDDERCDYARAAIAKATQY